MLAMQQFTKGAAIASQIDWVTPLLLGG